MSSASPRVRRAVLSCLLGAAWLVASPHAAAQAQRDGGDSTAAYIRAHYAKREVRIPMRDGVELFTAIYTPNDAGAKKYPILLFRTPYSVRPYGADRYPDRLGPTDAYAREGFLFVYQDVRGTYMSQGDFVNMRPIDDKRKKGRATPTSPPTPGTPSTGW